MNLKECYLAVGGDYEDVMRRFLQENRVDRFLSMFLRDQSYDLLCTAYDEKNFEDVFRAVHTLKGVCMNLSLTALQDACVVLTENLRSGKPDGQTENYIKNVKKEYFQTTTVIRRYLI